MQGLIHIELERFGRSALGEETWARVARDAGVAGKVYAPTERYDDADVIAVVVAAAKETGTGPQSLLEAFGRSIVPTLMDTFGRLVDPDWRTLELIANTEALIHTALRESDERARPPLLRTTPRPPDSLVVHYGSNRQMCGVAKGIIHGVADHYGEVVEVSEESCMLAGDALCAIVVRRK